MSDNHMDEHPENKGDLIKYDAAWDSYYLVVSGYEGEVQTIQHINNCPWCGIRLPDSKRDEWHDALESLGIDWTEKDTIPEKFKSAAWRT